MWIAAVEPEAIVALVAASLAILGFIIDRVVVPASRRLRGRREPKRLARALADLRCGVQLQRFTDLLGQPPTRSLGSSHLYVFDDVFVDVETDDHSNVSRFASISPSGGRLRSPSELRRRSGLPEAATPTSDMRTALSLSRRRKTMAAAELRAATREAARLLAHTTRQGDTT